MAAAQRDLNAANTAAREALFRGALSPSAFRQQGHLNARAYNEAILSTIDTLAEKGRLTPKLHSALVRELRQAGFDAGRTWAEAFRESGQSAMRAGQAITRTGVAATVGITLPTVLYGKTAVQQAADAAETANKFNVVFGPLAENVQKRLDELYRTVPRTRAQLQDMTATFNALLLPMGFAPKQAAEMSLRLVELAADITSLQNVPLGDVMTRLVSGLTGETAAVDRLGVNIRERRLEALALAEGWGKNVQQLSLLQRTQLIYNAILTDTRLAHGDMERTMGSFSNQLRFAERNWGELYRTIGERLIPSLTPALARFNAIVTAIAQASPRTLEWAIALAGVAAVVGPILIVVGSLTTAIGGLARAIGFLLGSTAIAGLRAALMGPAGLIILFGSAAAALVAWGARARSTARNLDELRASIAGLTQAQLQNTLSDSTQRLATLRADLARLQRATPVASPSLPSSIAARQAHLDKIAAVRREIEEQETLAAETAKRFAEESRRTREAEEDQRRLAAAYKATIDEYRRLAEQQEAASGKRPAQIIAALEQFVGQIRQAIEASARIRDTSIRFTDDIISAYGQVERAIAASGNLARREVVRLQEIRAEIERLMLGPRPEVRTITVESRLERSTRAIAPPAVVPQIDLARFADVMTAAAERANMNAEARRGLTRIGETVIPTPMIPRPLPPPPDPNVLRARLALQDFTDGLKTAGGAVGRFALDLGRQFLSALNPLRLFGEGMGAIGEGFRSAIEPLTPVFRQLGAIIGSVLRPVFEALAPVVEALTPVIEGVMRVIAPILKALAPILLAFVPILEALFPIFKLLGIIITYIGQAFTLAGGIILRVAGNIAVGFGKIIEGIARAIDALPFVSARGAIRAGQQVQEFGRGMIAGADQMRRAFNEMARARDEIRGLKLRDTADAVDDLADAARDAADAIRNIPQWYRLAYTVWSATLPQPAPTQPTAPPPDRPTTPPPDRPTDRGPQSPQGDGRGRGSGEGRALLPGGWNVNVEKIEIAGGSKSGAELLAEMMDELRRISLATFGTEDRWYEVDVRNFRGAA